MTALLCNCGRGNPVLNDVEATPPVDERAKLVDQGIEGPAKRKELQLLAA